MAFVRPWVALACQCRLENPLRLESASSSPAAMRFTHRKASGRNDFALASQWHPEGSVMAFVGPWVALASQPHPGPDRFAVGKPHLPAHQARGFCLFHWQASGTRATRGRPGKAVRHVFGSRSHSSSGTVSKAARSSPASRPRAYLAQSDSGKSQVRSLNSRYAASRFFSFSCCSACLM